MILYSQRTCCKPRRLRSCAGVLAAPPPQSRQKLVAGLGSDHIPLVVDVGLCTPISKSGEVESQRREDNTTSPVVNIPHSPPSCDSSREERILEMLASLEHRLEALDSKVSRPGMLVELKWALVASTLGSVLFAASTMLLGSKLDSLHHHPAGAADLHFRTSFGCPCSACSRVRSTASSNPFRCQLLA